MKTWVIACLALAVAVPVAVGGDELEAGQQAAMDEPAEPALREELLAMFEADQAAQQRVIKGGGNAATAEMAALNARHLERLKAIIDEHGWPTHDLVGKDGAHAAWLLVQHMDADPDFQKRCLTLLESAVARGQASARDLAYLTDRVRVARGSLQVYRTQFRQEDGYTVLAPVEDPETLDQRRVDVGLPTMAEYLGTSDEKDLSGHKDKALSAMIARIWNGWTTPANADRYEQLLRDEILPGIAAMGIEGYRGAEVLKRPDGKEVRFMTILRFDSLDAVRALAGEDHERAHVPDPARELLSRFDTRVAHYQVGIEAP